MRKNIAAFDLMDNNSVFNKVLDAKNILHENFLPYQYLMTNILKSEWNRNNFD